MRTFKGRGRSGMVLGRNSCANDCHQIKLMAAENFLNRDNLASEPKNRAGWKIKPKKPVWDRFLGEHEKSSDIRKKVVIVIDSWSRLMTSLWRLPGKASGSDCDQNIIAVANSLKFRKRFILVRPKTLSLQDSLVKLIKPWFWFMLMSYYLRA